MTARYECDHCHVIIDGGPWRVNFPTVDVDEDGDLIEWSDDADLCGPQCLTAWALATSMAMDDGEPLADA